ncbi:MAG: 2-C-methyl-D-erythritol 4-phosphate cytidylyltransferase [Candidatus Dadabacteria bacterium]|nr:MAG: 2-C-methyl-D-erythritol 4-phosphate cytidylyltransferase [Candidatus Dadabacteria bacterium]
MNFAIITAGGIGKRAGLGFNKVFALVRGKPLIWYSLKAFCSASCIDEVVVIAGSCREDLSLMESIVDFFGFYKVKTVVKGGATRMASIQNGLNAIKGDDNDWVFIHDGSRPFITGDTLHALYSEALSMGAAVCGCESVDTIVNVDNNNFISGSMERGTIALIQTPVCARYADIIKARSKAIEDGYINKDGYEDSTLLYLSGVSVKVLPIASYNIKITTQIDLKAADIIAGDFNV